MVKTPDIEEGKTPVHAKKTGNFDQVPLPGVGFEKNPFLTKEEIERFQQEEVEPSQKNSPTSPANTVSVQNTSTSQGKKWLGQKVASAALSASLYMAGALSGFSGLKTILTGNPDNSGTAPTPEQVVVSSDHAARDKATADRKAEIKAEEVRLDAYFNRMNREIAKENAANPLEAVTTPSSPGILTHPDMDAMQKQINKQIQEDKINAAKAIKDADRAIANAQKQIASSSASPLPDMEQYRDDTTHSKGFSVNTSPAAVPHSQPPIKGVDSKGHIKITTMTPEQINIIASIRAQKQQVAEASHGNHQKGGFTEKINTPLPKGGGRGM